MKQTAVTSDAYIYTRPMYSLLFYRSLTNGKPKRNYIYEPSLRPGAFAATGGLYTIFRVLTGAHLYLEWAVSELFVVTEGKKIPLNPYAEPE